MSMSAGPWELRDEIYNRDDCSIYTTQDLEWVVKVLRERSRALDELAGILEVRRAAVPNAVEFPEAVHEWFGVLPSGDVWYAMRHYDCAATVTSPEVRAHWQRFGQSVLTFLQYLHQKCHRVHMDVKVSNVLVNRLRSRFVVSDYDLVSVVHLNKAARYYPADTLWYYVAMGAELDEPLYTWRMDLTALAYMLASVTWDHDANNRWKFYDECMRRRGGGAATAATAAAFADSATATLTDAELIALRETEMQRIHPTVRAFLDHVKTLPWSTPAPPPSDFYHRLFRLLL